MRVAFAGTPEFAAVALEALLANGFTVPLVLTQPDRPAGRGLLSTPSPVKTLALAHGIPVDQPERLATVEQRAALAACAPDLLVVAAYGLLLPPAALQLPRLGCINIHASLLPRWRGAAPIHRAIEAGDAATGITIMQMDAGLDTGPMLLREALPIDAHDTTGSLHDRLAALGGRLVVSALRAIAGGDLTPIPQPAEGVSYARKISKAEALLDWTRDAPALERAVRAFNPFPGASTHWQGHSIKIWQAELADGEGAPGTVLAADANGIVVACGVGALRCRQLQKAGGKRLMAADFLRGTVLAAGEQFG